MNNFGLFIIEFTIFVTLGTVNTMSRFGYIQKSSEDQAGMWMLFFALSGFILIHLLLALMEAQKQSRTRHKLELLLDDIFLQVKREDDPAQLRILSQGITTMQEDPSAYENYLLSLKDDVKVMIRKLCDIHNQHEQENFGRGLDATYRSDVFIKTGDKIASLEAISAACKNA